MDLSVKYTILLQASQIKTITVRLTQLCCFLTYLLDWYLSKISGNMSHLQAAYPGGTRYILGWRGAARLLIP